MGRKNRNAIVEQKSKAKAAGAAAKLNKVKKDKNAFKVTSQNKVKKAKQVTKQVQNVKKVNAKTSEKLNSQLKDLHKDMVVKKPQPAPRKVEKSKQKAGPKAKDVAAVLAKMDM